MRGESLPHHAYTRRGWGFSRRWHGWRPIWAPTLPATTRSPPSSPILRPCCGNDRPVGAFIAILLTIAVSLLITRVGTSALVHTGLSRPVARFQARSAFFGVGFTTSESEAVVNHPVRRRIILWLVLLGNAGIVTVLASVVLSARGGFTPVRVVTLAAGLVALALLARSRMLERAID